jgi:hypothetical protein
MGNKTTISNTKIGHFACSFVNLREIEPLHDIIAFG